MMGFSLKHLNLLLVALLVPLTFLWVFLIACFKKREAGRKFTVAFFHPYCNAGGGGERVLWIALRSLQQRHPDYAFVVYTGDNVPAPEMIANVKKRFNISLSPDSLTFVLLRRRSWVEASTFPSFTLLGQSLGSVLLGLEALLAINPDVLVDSMGYAFALPAFKWLGGNEVAAYVHYPTISTDMLSKVAGREGSYNNASTVASSATLSSLKLTYYRVFAALYSFVGRSSVDVVMVNSTWTEGHINALWKIPSLTAKVYPPCDVAEFKAIPQPADDSGKVRDSIRIVSVAQFRPEKDHPLQLKALAELRTLVAKDVWDRVQLDLVGSVRNEEDEGRVASLRELAQELDLQDHVVFHLNVSFPRLKEVLGAGLIGLHTMWNEHFGIGIVECMAAGLIMVAHRSGGPLADIIDEDEEQRNGYLAESPLDYARTLASILSSSPAQRGRIRGRARASVDRFSDDKFSTAFLGALSPLLETRIVH